MRRITRKNPVLTLLDVAAALGSVNLVPKTVKPDGTGDFLTVKEASDWAWLQTTTSLYEIRVYPGVYTDVNWTVAPKVARIQAVGELHTVWLKGENPDSANDDASEHTSTFWVKTSCELRGLKITAKNMRYPVHSEDSGLNKDAVHVVDGCWIEHYGNQGIVDYRVANSLPAGSPFTSVKPWGYGSASGVKTVMTNTALVGPREAFYVHSREDFIKPTINTLDRCRLITTDPTKPAVVVQGLGSGTTDQVNIAASEVSGGNYISESDTPWISTSAAGQYANHSDLRIAMSGVLLGFSTTNRGKALKIESASTSSTSTVRVSGTAASAIFGSLPYYRDGGGGMKGYLWGHLDISGILVGINADTTVNNTLGRRLGDCSTTSKTLTVTVDGGSPVNVVFNTNLTAASNATIISTINSALSTAATASEYLVSQGEVYPDCLDRQQTLVNSDTVCIPRWSAVKKVSGKVQLLGTGDAATLFYGVALEPIPPGGVGRILTEGLLTSSQLAGNPAVTDGATMYHDDSNAGQLKVSGTRVFGKGQLNGFCYFKGN